MAWPAASCATSPTASSSAARSAVAADVVGTLRLYAGRNPDDPQLSELVGEL
ncbi:hypothetical protein ABZ610_26270, partial [Micromonospora aurantiaca]